MAGLQADNNIAGALVDGLIPPAGPHDVITAALGLIRANDSEHLLAATSAGRLLLTADSGSAPLHEAWQTWLVNRGLAPPHGGIIELPSVSVRELPQVAQMINTALAQGWSPVGQLWRVNPRPGFGWRWFIGRSSTHPHWTIWVTSVFDPAVR